MTKVLVVDDSALMRKLLVSLLQSEGFEVQTARTGLEGVNMLTEFEPDVVTLDINMPEMDGLTALSLMMQTRPTPIVMVSSLTTKGAMATLEALAMGAFDFVAKPGGTISLSIEEVGKQLIQKVRAAARARLRGSLNRARASRSEGAGREPAAVTGRTQSAKTTVASKPIKRPVPSRVAKAGGTRNVPGVVLIGVSTGGPSTLEDILPKLPAHFPWPVLLAQHMPANFTAAFANRMDRVCAMTVREVNAPMPIEAGHIYVAQGGADMVLVERMGRLVVQPRPENPDHLWHPSVDVLVNSALKVLQPNEIVGVLLTGMGNDGAKAMAALHGNGGCTIAESEESAVVFGMPRELIEQGGASVILDSEDIAEQLCTWIEPAV